MAVFTAILSALLGAQLQDFNIPNIHFPDVIVMSIIIPFIYLLNDDFEKEVEDNDELTINMLQETWW